MDKIDKSRGTERAMRSVIVPVAAIVLLTLAPSAPAIESVLDSQIDFVRTRFYAAVDHPELVDELSERIEETYSADWRSYSPAVAGYSAALEGLKGKQARGLRRKLGHIQTAIERFQFLVQRFPEDLEVRFLRYSLYHQLPSFFGVGHLVAVDLAAVIGLLRTCDCGVSQELREGMIAYILDTDLPDTDQRENLERLLVDRHTTLCVLYAHA